MSKFDKIVDKLNFPDAELQTLEYWTAIDAFKTSLKLSEGKPEYTFYDGPPFATGLPHYGHLLAGTIKDTVTRYAHQTDHYVSRRFGWDCHGLPVEYEIDKKLGITGRDMVLQMGVANYNAECRSIVQRYTAEWEKTVSRLGRWIDFKNDYKTMDPQFMESVWWVFKTLFEKGLVYRGYKVMPYSTACGTPLSNFEAGLDYRDTIDPAVVVTFPLVSDPNINLIAWTTTPWTLPSNLALCVNESFQYIKIIDKSRNNKIFILLEKRLSQLFPEVAKADCTEARKNELYEVVERMTGKDLVGLKYSPIFPYFFDSLKNQAFRVVSDNYVTEEGGTGIVHQAPAFGEDDYRVCITNGIVNKGDDLPCPVDANGRFTEIVEEFKGIHVKEADNSICTLLKSTGRLVLKENYKHPYPYCWRSETPLIYKAVPSWFVAVEKVKAQLLKNNSQTYWVPSFVQEKRFHNWLADAKDWAISRNRFWGTPIPLWISDDCEEMVPIGSVEELHKLSGVLVTDLHKENIDHITIPSQKGKGLLRRVDEVFDCWFESGSMPYAQLHYPFENKERFENGFPADFIAEGIDQTRGWFYTLMVISTCLFDRPAFKNLIANGLVLAADGKKMSKRLKNYPDPVDVINKYGADALRLYLINSPVVRAETLAFKEEGVQGVVRGVLLPWFNAFRFFIQCVERIETATGQAFTPDLNIAKSSTNDVDVWISAATVGLVKFVHQEMQAYRLYTVVPKLVGFIEELTNWYVRLNRDRLKGSLGDQEACVGLNVLSDVLFTMTRLMSPFTPFFCEYLYQQLRKLQPLYKNTDPSVPLDAIGKADSVHYLMLPALDESRLNQNAVSRFNTLQAAVTAARNARELKKIRSNLPLRSVLVVASRQEDIEALNYLKQYFLSEINAWDLTLSSDMEKYCIIKILPNFESLGPKLGKQIGAVKKELNDLKADAISQFMSTGKITIAGLEMSKDDLLVKIEFNGDKNKYQAVVSDDGSLVVAIDYTCDEEILSELRARQIAAEVQKLRKSSGLTINDKVEFFYEDTTAIDGGKIAESLKMHADTTVKRIKSIPLPISVAPKYSAVFASEVVKDEDISVTPVKLVFKIPVASVDIQTVCDDFKVDINIADMIAMYVQTMDYNRVCGLNTINVTIDNRSYNLMAGKHYFSSASDMVKQNQQRFAKLV